MAYELRIVDAPPPRRRGSSSPPVFRTRYLSTCPNCGDTFEWIGQATKTYCGPACSSEAEAIRYARKEVAEYAEGSWPEAVGYAVRIQIAHALTGGYDRAARHLSDDIRALVVKRDGGQCRLYSEPGEDIDHIDRPSAVLTNLRLLCKSCHTQVTSERLQPIDDPDMAAQLADIWRRIRLAEPERPSDAADWRAHRAAWPPPTGAPLRPTARYD